MLAFQVLLTINSRSPVFLGIGLAISKYLISQSQNVVVVARSKDLLDKLHHDHPQQVRALPGDMTEMSLPAQAVDLAMKEFGQLDGVIINHGIMDPVARVEDASAQDWATLFAVNFFSSVAFVSRNCGGFGVMLISSGQGRSPAPPQDERQHIIHIIRCLDRRI